MKRHLSKGCWKGSKRNFFHTQMVTSRNKTPSKNHNLEKTDDKVSNDFSLLCT